MSRLIFAFVLLLGGTLSCFAQTGVLPSYRNASGGTTEVSAANPFPVTGGGGGGGLSVTDQAAFTYGVSPFTPTGGFYNAAITALSSGQQGAVALTANRSMHVLDDNSAAILSALSFDVGAGTGGTKTQRVLIDSSQIDPSVPAGSADSGNPTKIGTVAASSLAAQAPYANGNRANTFSDLDGALIVRTDAPLSDILVGNAVSDTAGAVKTLIAAPGASIRAYLKDVTFVNTSSTFISVTLACGTTSYTVPVPANSGYTKTFPLALPCSATNTAWTFQGSAAITTLTGSGTGFKSKV